MGQGTDFENLGDSYDASYNSGQDTDWQSFSGYDQGDDSNGYGVDFQDLQNTSWPETTDGYSNNGSFDPYAQGGGQDDWENPSGGFLSGYGQDLVTDPALLGGVAQGFGDLDFGLQDSDSYGNDDGQTSAAQNGVDAYSGTYMPEGYGMPEGVNGFFNAELDGYGTLPPGALAMGGSDPTTPGNGAGALGGPVKPTDSPTNNGTPRNPETESGSVDIKVRQNPEGGGSFSGEYCQSEKGGSTSVSAQLDINERGQVGGEIHYKHKYGGAPTGQNNCQE